MTTRLRTSPAAPAHYDITIIGAGVIGTAIARSLSKLDAKVALVDCANDVGQGTSKANTAILHTGFDATPGTLESQLVREGYGLLGRYAEETGIPVERTGAILVAWTEEEKDSLPGLADKARQNGYHDSRLIDASEVYRRLPDLGPGALAGLEIPGESIICPWTTTLAFATEAVENDVDLRLDHRVQRISVGADLTTVETTRGSITTGWLINAAGLGAATIDGMLGLDRFEVTPRRGELIVFDKSARKKVPLIVLPVPSTRGKGVLVSPTVYGNVMLGPTSEDLDDPTATQTTEGGFRFLQEKARRLMPDLFEHEITTSYAGLRAAIDRNDYLIDVDPVRRYVLLGGIRSTGLSASMALAEHTVRLLRGSGVELTAKPDVAAAPHMPNIGEARPRPYERPELIASDPSYGTVVCFCERVTSGEIRDALQSRIPPRDRSGLSRRTRATNGRCQGFYCGAEIERRLRTEGEMS